MCQQNLTIQTETRNFYIARYMGPSNQVYNISKITHINANNLKWQLCFANFVKEILRQPLPYPIKDKNESLYINYIPTI